MWCVTVDHKDYSQCDVSVIVGHADHIINVM